MTAARRVAITGGHGQLGRQLAVAFPDQFEVWAPGHDELDIVDRESLDRLRDWRPDVVINAAAWTDVDGAARDPDRAMQINGEAAGWVAAVAADVGAVAVQVSTNEVFDGTAEQPYDEDDLPNPINPYGTSKLAGERAVAASSARHLIVRTAWIFGPEGRNFPSKITEIAHRQAVAGQPLKVVSDEMGNPTWAPDLAQAIHHLVRRALGDDLPSVIHVAGEPATSRFEWARAILANMPDVEILPIRAAEYPRPSRVPLRAVLATLRAKDLGIAPSDWRGRTADYVRHLQAAAAT